MRKPSPVQHKALVTMYEQIVKKAGTHNFIFEHHDEKMGYGTVHGTWMQFDDILSRTVRALFAHGFVRQLEGIYWGCTMNRDVYDMIRESRQADKMGELRQLLAHPVSQSSTTTSFRSLDQFKRDRDVFEQIMCLFWDWDNDDERTMGIQYAEQHLADWPDDVRILPPCFYAGMGRDFWCLARTVGHPEYWDNDDLATLFSTPEIASCTSYDLQEAPRSRSAKRIRSLLDGASARAGNLHELMMSDCSDLSVVEIARHPNSSQLKGLYLKRPNLSFSTLSGLLQSRYLHGLEKLTIAGARVRFPIFKVLAEYLHTFPNLHSLNLWQTHTGNTTVDDNYQQMLKLLHKARGTQLSWMLIKKSLFGPGLHAKIEDAAELAGVWIDWDDT